MQHHRCNKCRNPIGGFPVPCPSLAGHAWYHTDCWAEVRASEQDAYRAEIDSAGLAALFAPYSFAASGRVAT